MAYDLNGRLASITDSRRTVTYGHDSIGNLTTVTGPEASVTTASLPAGTQYRLQSDFGRLRRDDTLCVVDQFR